MICQSCVLILRIDDHAKLQGTKCENLVAVYVCTVYSLVMFVANPPPRPCQSAQRRRRWRTSKGWSNLTSRPPCRVHQSQLDHDGWPRLIMFPGRCCGLQTGWRGWRLCHAYGWGKWRAWDSALGQTKPKKSKPTSLGLWGRWSGPQDCEAPQEGFKGKSHTAVTQDHQKRN